MIEARYYVYIVRTSANKLYTGVTTDPTRRIREHNESDSKGAKCLRGQRPVTLVWNAPEPMSHSEALILEALIKKFPRSKKERFIQEALELPRVETFKEIAARVWGY